MAKASLTLPSILTRSELRRRMMLVPQMFTKKFPGDKKLVFHSQAVLFAAWKSSMCPAGIIKGNMSVALLFAGMVCV